VIAALPRAPPDPADRARVSVLEKSRMTGMDDAPRADAGDPHRSQMFPGTGEMATRMRALDWSKTPIGPVERWPQSLRTVVSICLASRFPMEVRWGPEYVRLYNDAYRPILGANKHPQFLGRPTSECWSEIWDVIGPMHDSVRATGQATWSEDLQLMMTRNGYVEETYFTFSYSPVFDEGGGVGGILCTCAETTARVLVEQRLRMLRELGAHTGAASTVEETCAAVLRTLGKHTAIVPFALLYLLDEQGREARLAGTCGFPDGHAARSSIASLVSLASLASHASHDERAPGFRLAEAARTGALVEEQDLVARFGPLPGGAWPEPPTTAVILPIAHAGQDRPSGLLVAGVNPRRALDDDYRTFFALAGSHVASALAKARALEDERRRAEALAEASGAKAEAQEKAERLLAAEQRALAEAAAQRDRLHRLFMQAPAMVCLLRGPTHVFELANPHYMLAVGHRPVVGKAIREALPELEGQGLYELLDRVFQKGERFVGDAVPVMLDRHGDGTREETFFNFTYEPMLDVDQRPEGVMVVAYEVTEQVRARRRAETLAEELRRSEELFRVSQDVSPIGFSYYGIVRDERGAVVDLELQYQNGAAARINRLPAGRECAGTRMLTAFPGLRDAGLWDTYRCVAETGEPWQGEVHYSGEYFNSWFRLAGVRPTPDSFALIFEDITARKRVEQALRLLADASTVLTASLDDRERLGELVRLAVPRFSEWCVVELRDASGSLRRIDIAHADPAEQPLAEQVRRLSTRVDRPDHPRARVLSTARPVLIREFTDEMAQAMADDEAHLALMRAIGTRSIISVPLIARGHTLGVITFSLGGKSGRRFDEADLALAEELGKRAATAVDNARLFRETQAAAREREAILGQIADGVIVVDPAGRIQFANEAACRLYGVAKLGAPEEDDRAGYELFTMDGQPYPPEELPLRRAVQRDEAALGVELRIRRADGTQVITQGNALPVRDAGGRKLGAVMTLRDMTERVRAEHERERLIAALERSNRELDQFAYVASHDLKAPLRGIANLSQWIEEDLSDRMTAEAHEHMRLLRGRVHRLEALIEGILSYSRAGRVRDKVEAVDVGRLVADVVELLAPHPGAVVEIAPGMPALQAERVPLQQVFMNLVGNALKYAQRGDPHVRVEARDAGVCWEFSVADNGPGIAPQYHARIWGIFQTLEARDKIEGTGIGLSVVQKIVESRGGRAWVESAEGQGATFRFTWPKHSAPAR